MREISTSVKQRTTLVPAGEQKTLRVSLFHKLEHASRDFWCPERDEHIIAPV